ncbi:Alpha/Beta hydrolase protein [Apodospora peruviana]|uniref:Carboxypeptidase n=1 Tax=Apodospora peruviana TaxID=516989 RepID=A0AAE0LYA5_9PEZI|nr:Alpha/Beta hydrolase protein [Apodospora peruviana]
MLLTSKLAMALGSLVPMVLAYGEAAASNISTTLVNSTAVPGAYLTYKQTEICETTPGVKSYAGYVHLPPNTVPGQDYEIHTFFWFFQARRNSQTAPLSLWFQGGPGAPSVTSPVSENGPCVVTNDSTTTELNPWSWNNDVNMLYIDQPVQVGFSYDTLVNGIVDEVKSPFHIAVVEEPTKGNFTHRGGVFASQRNTTITNTTMNSAEAIWNFMQVWMQEFPEYKSSDDNKFSIWSESYGGHYGPIFADFFSRQNEQIAAGKLSNDKAKPLTVDSIGIINGCIDSNVQMASYPQMAFNNTYNIKAINETMHEAALANVDACTKVTNACHKLADEKDPDFKGTNDEVNAACQKAFNLCFGTVWAPYMLSGRNVFDITSPILSSFPPKWAAGYLNRKEIQEALGVPLNFTGLSDPVSQVFNFTGDFMRGNALASIGRLLDSGVKVTLMYGDSDYQCNWLGGEQISLAIKSEAISLKDAGYTKMVTNESYSGGLTRQHGRLSFSRVFNAGHSVPYYQPETAYQIFKRSMFGMDIATGKEVVNDKYATTGLKTAFALDTKAAPELLPPAGQEAVRDCYLWDVLETCDGVQKQFIANGTAITKDYILLGYRLENGTEIFYPGKGQSGDVSPPPGNNTAPGDGGNPDPSPTKPADAAAPTSAGARRHDLMAAPPMVAFSVVVIVAVKALFA